MKFGADEEFIKNDQRVYDKVLLQTEDSVNFGRPIGELLAQIGRSSAEDDGKILAGPSLNDEDDENSTLESLKYAEQALATKMPTPEYSKKNF